jgi:predicted lipoprotein with Yx(FWY)xxD motif
MIARKLVATSIASLALVASTTFVFAQAPAQPQNVTGLGEVLVDANGRVLYMLSADEATPGASSCYDDCAAAWPPVILDGSLPGRTVLGTIIRADGAVQLTWSGKPLYRFGEDVNPGEAKGDGVSAFGGVWSVARPSAAGR